MLEPAVMAALLDSLVGPLMYVDTDHVIRYMNKAAIAHYRGGATLLGSSVLDCHTEQQQAALLEIVEAMQSGEEERLTIEDESRRIYMRAVRDGEGRLLGYYERYEPRTG